MKGLFIFFTLTTSFITFAKVDCQNFSNSKKMELIKNSPYPVEDIQCKNGSLKWVISNRKYMKQNYARLPASSAKNNRPSTVKDNAKQDLIGKSNLNLLASISFGSTAISETDNVSKIKETVISDISVGINVSLSHQWSENLSLTAFASLKSLDFKAGESRELSNQKITQVSTNIYGQYKLSSTFQFTSGLGLNDSTFLSSDGSGTLELINLPVPTAFIATKLNLYQSEKQLKLNFFAEYGQMFKAKRSDIQLNHGKYLTLGFESEAVISDRSVITKVSFIDRETKTDRSNQGLKDLGISMGVRWNL